MCNACGMVCCAWDSFSGCGCDCGEIECLEKCARCGGYIELDLCECDLDEYDEVAI